MISKSDAPAEDEWRALSLTESEFLRRYLTRAPVLMWFLGAGASAAAGIPTASDMVWDFKRLLYRTDRKVSPAETADLTNPAVVSRIQEYLDSTHRYPSRGDPDEYARYFEAAYPDEADRRTYIAAKSVGVHPSYGQLALATLLHADKARIVWTTNFDGLVEDSCAAIYETTTALTVATPDSAQIARDAVNEERWPLLVKLHGDFRSRRLKNTPDELRAQDAMLRSALRDSCRRWGLVVIGFSGRDDSVMEVIEEACHTGNYPGGLFWLFHAESPPGTRVIALIKRARAVGIDANLVEVGSFDELVGDVAQQFEDLTESLRAKLDAKRQRVSDAPPPRAGSGWPVLRVNALEILEWPNVMRRVVCSIGGLADLRRAIAAAGVHVLATRTASGVLAFGSDEAVHRVLDPYDVESFDLQALERHRLYRDTHERELIHEAVVQAAARGMPLAITRRRTQRFLVPTDGSASAVAGLTRVTGALTGTLPMSGLVWSEALSLRLDFALGRLWLLLEPRVWFDRPPDSASKVEAANFARERFARRYNREWNRLLEAWVSVILYDRRDGAMTALGIADGVDARFRIDQVTAYSRPLRV